MTLYALNESFNLEGWEPVHQRCFALGVEWQQFFDKLRGGAPFRATVHLANARRLTALAEKYGRFSEYHRINGDWAEIIVGGRGAA